MIKRECYQSRDGKIFFNEVDCINHEHVTFEIEHKMSNTKCVFYQNIGIELTGQSLGSVRNAEIIYIPTEEDANILCEYGKIHCLNVPFRHGETAPEKGMYVYMCGLDRILDCTHDGDWFEVDELEKIVSNFKKLKKRLQK